MEEDLTDFLDDSAARFAGKHAIETPAGPTTYGELRDHSIRIARALLDRGDDPSRPVVLLLSDPREIIAAMYGVWRAGRFFAVLDTDYPRERIESILSDSDARTVIVDRSSRGLLPANAGAAPLLVESTLDVNPMEIPRPAIDDKTICQITYTSGTTSKPKGVIRLRRAMANVMRGYACSPDERVTSLTSLAFGGGSASIHWTLRAGATLCHISVRSLSLPALANWIDRQRITILRCPPSLFRPLMEMQAPGRRFLSVRQVRLSGERVTRRHVELFRERFEDDCQLWINLASSEGAVYASLVAGKDFEFEGDMPPVGYPNPAMDVRIVDDEGSPVPAGEVGEIIVSAETVSPGYWNDPGLTAARISIDPANSARRILRTGDLGRLDDKGLLYFLGRKDGQLKVRGHRVTPGEVEELIMRDSSVRETAVVGLRNQFGETSLAAFLVVDRTFDLAAFRTELRARVPAYMLPAVFRVVESLPMNVNGKIDRNALAERALSS